MELVAEEAKKDAASLQQVAVVGHPSMTRPAHEFDPHRKVT
jgi:hypothetical protein